jgi:hypothetical protein
MRGQKMAAQTLLYLYYPRQLVVLLELEANTNRRYQKVYAKDLLLNHGVDNLLEFSFVNQEQKSVDITGKTITFRLLNYNGTEILLQKSLFSIYPLTGLAALRVTADELKDIEPQQCHYSLEIPVDTWNYPVFVDSNSGARGVMRIVNSVLPTFLSSTSLSIPSHPTPTSSNIPLTYYSSVWYSKQNNYFTFQLKLENFTGTITYQGSTLEDFSINYDISSSISYTDYSGVVYFNIEGYHPFIRLKIVNSGTEYPVASNTYIGDLTEILVR